MQDDRTLKVFFLEDNPDDIELELYELRKAGLKIEYDVARNWKEFMSKLPNIYADIILADYTLPDITGIEAITICREMNMDIPVILLTGEGNEMNAVDSLRHGAVDYIIKRNISGLYARVMRALEIWADRKAKKRAEEEEKKLQVLLLETQKMEAIGRLAGGIAHDFNNLLTGIMGYSELCLKDTDKGSPIHTKLQSIITLSQRGADLVKQLLIFSRKLPMEFVTVNLNTFLIETMHFLKRIVEETVEIQLELQEDIPNIRCDANQFTQVLMNLVLNARDAMDGRGVLKIKTGMCSLSGELMSQNKDRAGEYVCLYVSDTGVGIPKEDINKVFDPFFTTKEMGKGTGLGLSIVYSVIREHNGWIDVESEKGAGSIFRICLPAVEEKVQEISGEDAAGEQEMLKIQGNENILIAEDEDVLRELMASILRTFGYHVITARDGEEAIEIYRAGLQKIDIVISDMLMPVKGGAELFKELKQINPQVKFILVTGYTLVDQDENLLNQMDAVITKPYSTINIMGLVREILDR